MKFVFSFVLLTFSIGIFSQIEDPIKWTTSVEKISDSEYVLVSVADIEKGWHLYSQNVPNNGPIPTKFFYDISNSNFSLIGSTIEDKGHIIDDPVFRMKIKFFENKAIFKQKVKLESDVNFIKGSVEFMVCDDAKCLPPSEIEITFNLSKNNNAKEKKLTGGLDILINSENANTLLYGIDAKKITHSNTKCQSEANNSTPHKNDKKSLWSIFALGFLGGLLALLTPCVFPMIPLTVSFFTKKDNKNKSPEILKALLYGFFIFVVYVALSLPFHLLDSITPDVLNEISTSTWLNFIFFIIFVFFAFSFFGYYELTLPSKWSNITTKAEDSGGFIGIFFMALTLAIVSFSCTGPILGSLLAGSLASNSGAWQLTAGMAGFGVSLGLPFALFAMFPNFIKALPKSGEWLNTTKIILGFLELAFAFKFLSNADLVAHWNILKIEPFLILWIIVFSAMALYLFGKIKFPNTTTAKNKSFLRIASGVLVISFVVYLTSGFKYNEETKTFTPLKLLSGLAPPVGYSFIYPNECPNNLNCFKDLKKGIEYAKKVNKPILLDFTGYACVNCRKMEEHVWSLKKIDNYLRNEYVLISLYVDDKKQLPKEQQIIINNINGKPRKLKNYGHKWANFQAQFFNTNSQPYYVLLNSDASKILNKPIGYMPYEIQYLNFLKCGVEVFNNFR